MKMRVFFRPEIGNEYFRKVDEPRPVLPRGWKYLDHPSKLLMVESPEKKLYLVERQDACKWNSPAVELIRNADNQIQFATLQRFRFSTIWDCVRTVGRLRTGNIFVPYREEVII